MLSGRITVRAFADEPTKAIAVLHPTTGSNVEGTVTFTKAGDEMKVVADLTGLTPGKHGFHIHEFGDCSSPDGKARRRSFQSGQIIRMPAMMQRRAMSAISATSRRTARAKHTWN